NVARSRASPKKRFQIGREPHAVRAARPGKQLGNRSIHIHTIQAALWMLTERPGEDTAFRVGNDIIETIHAILRELLERGVALIQLQLGDILVAEYIHAINLFDSENVEWIYLIDDPILFRIIVES